MTSLVFLPSPSPDFLALEKPAGRVVHGPGGLLSEVRREVGDVALVHRLDRETSGVLLFAKSPAALAEAHAAWPARVAKTYVARTRGVPSPREGTVDAPLLEHRSGKPELLKRALVAAYGAPRAGLLLAGRRVRAIPPVPPPGRTSAHPAGRSARTDYRVIVDEGASAIVELRPHRGRMHQIRVHLAALGTPLLGDRFYDASAKAETPFLHALRVEWSDPPGTAPGTVWRFESPITAPPPR